MKGIEKVAKFLLQQQGMERLVEDLLQVEQAAWAAYETATTDCRTTGESTLGVDFLGAASSIMGP